MLIYLLKQAIKYLLDEGLINVDQCSDKAYGRFLINGKSFMNFINYTSYLTLK